jgi:hypothetical protein
MISRVSFASLLTVPSLLTHTVLSTTFNNPIPRLARQADSGVTSCVSWLSLVDSCTAATPSFKSLPFSIEASCLCYSSSLWQPSVFDSAFDTCLSYLSTASPALYSSAGGATLPTDPCQQAGDVVATGSGGDNSAVASPTTTIGPTITSPSQPVNSGACVSFNLIQASCALATSSFTDLPFTVEASCLCYTSGTYAPSVFDGYWGACLGFYSTASPVFYSSLGGDTLTRTPCAEFGKVGGNSGPTTSPSSIGTPSSSILTTVVPTTATKADAPAGLRFKFHVWPIIFGVCFLIFV